MKRSKIFLTVSSFILAIAGIAATKANSHFVSGYYYETTAGSDNCAYVGISTNSNEFAAIPCVTFGGSQMYATITALHGKKCSGMLFHF
jgi:hypothetical protein